MKLIRKTIVACAVALASLSAQAGVFQARGTCSVFFSPKGGAQQAIVDAINGANQSIFVQAYSYTSRPINDALMQAVQRKVTVGVIVDKSQITAKGSKLYPAIEAGINARVDSKHIIAHNKTMVIDAKKVITGSFNFSAAAENVNAENVLICENVDQAKFYMENWLLHSEHAEAAPPNPKNEKREAK